MCFQPLRMAAIFKSPSTYLFGLDCPMFDPLRSNRCITAARTNTRQQSKRRVAPPTPLPPLMVPLRATWSYLIARLPNYPLSTPNDPHGLGRPTPQMSARDRFHSSFSNPINLLFCQECYYPTVACRFINKAVWTTENKLKLCNCFSNALYLSVSFHIKNSEKYISFVS
jgi:hypothetical protein